MTGMKGFNDAFYVVEDEIMSILSYIVYLLFHCYYFYSYNWHYNYEVIECFLRQNMSKYAKNFNVRVIFYGY